jgi:nucleoside-diphosphate-sugar epimerase
MTVLITGSSSYVGKNLISLLERKNIKYIGIDNKKPFNKNCLKIDIRNPNIYFLIKQKINSIIHLAAISNDKDCKKKLKDCLDINICGTKNIVDFARRKRIKKIIFASSEWVYGKNYSKTNSAVDINKIDSAYALTKYLCEKILVESKNICSIILRFGIIYGTRIGNFSAVESILYSIVNKRKLKINSFKSARSFVFINDISEAILRSISLKKTIILDVQGPRLVSIKKIVLLVQKQLYKKKILVEEINKKNISIRKISSNNLNSALKWSPAIDIEKGISLIIKEFIKKKLIQI